MAFQNITPVLPRIEPPPPSNYHFGPPYQPPVPFAPPPPPQYITTDFPSTATISNRRGKRSKGWRATPQPRPGKEEEKEGRKKAQKETEGSSNTDTMSGGGGPAVGVVPARSPFFCTVCVVETQNRATYAAHLKAAEHVRRAQFFVPRLTFQPFDTPDWIVALYDDSKKAANEAEDNDNHDDDGDSAQRQQPARQQRPQRYHYGCLLCRCIIGNDFMLHCTGAKHKGMLEKVEGKQHENVAVKLLVDVKALMLSTELWRALTTSREVVQLKRSVTGIECVVVMFPGNPLAAMFPSHVVLAPPPEPPSCGFPSEETLVSSVFIETTVLSALWISVEDEAQAAGCASVTAVRAPCVHGGNRVAMSEVLVAGARNAVTFAVERMRIITAVWKQSPLADTVELEKCPPLTCSQALAVEDAMVYRMVQLIPSLGTSFLRHLQSTYYQTAIRLISTYHQKSNVNSTLDGGGGGGGGGETGGRGWRAASSTTIEVHATTNEELDEVVTQLQTYMLQ